MKGTTAPELTATSAEVLTARQLAWSFGAHRVVDNVSLGVCRGEVLGVIGPNGAGKSTLFSLLAGERRPQAGSILLHGLDVTSRAVEQRQALGIGRTFQVPRPFAALSVLENVMLGAQHHPGERLLPALLRPGQVRRAETALKEEAMHWLKFTSLAPLAREPARVLSIGQRKLLELARVLISKPAVVLLDEPMAGVHPQLVEVLGETLRSLAQSGLTILLVEHQLSLIASLCTRVLVMAEGRVLLTGTPTDVLGDARVAEAYLGFDAA